MKEFNGNYLIAMAKDGNLEQIKLCLNAGVGINFTDQNKNNALMFAIVCGHTTVVKYLVENGIYINHMNDNHFTPIMYAAEEGRKEVVEYLIQKGSEIDAVNKGGDTALKLANANGHTETASLLNKKASEKVNTSAVLRKLANDKRKANIDNNGSPSTTITNNNTNKSISSTAERT